MTGTLYVVYGLPGSGKSHLIEHGMDFVDVRLTQIDGTKYLDEAVAYAERFIRRGKTVALESWGWQYPTDKDYPVINVCFEKNVKQCVRNVIADAVQKNRWYSDIRMDALIRGSDTYVPAGIVQPVYVTGFVMAMVNEFFRRFPGQYEFKVRSLLEQR